MRNPEQQARTREKDALLRLASCTQTPPQKLIEIAEIAQTRSYGVVLRTLARNVSCPPEALGILVTIDPFAVAKKPRVALSAFRRPRFSESFGRDGCSTDVDAQKPSCELARICPISP